MKVIITKAFAEKKSNSWVEGQEVVLADEIAKHLIETGGAVDAEEPKTKAEEPKTKKK